MDVKQIVTQLWYSPRWGEVLRFGIVGVVATLIQYGTYYLLNQCVGWGANASITIGYMVSVVCNFFLSNYFTFKTRPTFKKGVGFALSHCLNYVLQILFLNLYIGWGISESWAPLPMFATVVPINFLLVRLVLKSQS